MPSPTPQDGFQSLLGQHKKVLYKIAGSYCRDPADRPDLA